ncbi:hypothetical protein ELI49_31910 [Rhizobium ruizarguesonis]|uniref:Uncharacterized protein n=2 Tax=Rhizobium ruizarguesonis TaxID=2081791 RepID=A0AAE4YK75_9HYPH|nr:hypothetical protein [Rhizobium ruizarguesonis]NKL40213.1 hypothetical protein [Rhizobium leguminosarum bv. viciae]NEH77026.1 hypothetical protein [Rhizobium ruizarguesonis]NEI46435.1 hypothetical protein [Rhizobium ruizarguesonis]NEJ03945.1 hypothetical protein [Rhizobium ruizarguesonis]
MLFRRLNEAVRETGTFKTRFLEAGMNDAGRSGLRRQREVDLVPGQDRENWHSFDATGAVPFIRLRVAAFFVSSFSRRRKTG